MKIILSQFKIVTNNTNIKDDFKNRFEKMGYSKPRNPEPDQNLFEYDGSGTVYRTLKTDPQPWFFCMVVKGCSFWFIYTVSPIVVNVEHKVEYHHWEDDDNIIVRPFLMIVCEGGVARGIRKAIGIVLIRLSQHGSGDKLFSPQRAHNGDSST